MEQNLFQELEAKRCAIKAQAKKACELGWIDEAQECEIIGKIDNEILTLGVIGQMKCGKSTFINAFVFGDEVLPSATTPMTAALTVITYNPNKYGTDAKLIAEFYTNDEWEEQRRTACRSLDGVSEAEEMKIKAARELVAKSAVLGTELESLLGKTQPDAFEKLEEYVGANGKYVSITKAVTINYPRDYLKGVEIVDTPGFNDPIVSREERTRQFLKRADVVLLLLYAGRPFDSTDRSILFENVRACGVGKVVVGVNKYDIPYGNGETPEEIAQYVSEQIRNECEKIHDDSLADLVREAKPILLSANMALLSQLPMGKVNASESKSHAWDRYCDIFEISGQPQMREKSRIDDLIAAVRDIIEKEKGAILFKKPVNALMAAGNNLVGDIGRQKRETEALLVNLSKPDDELEDTLDSIGRVKRRLERKIVELDDSLTIAFRKRLKECHTRMEDELDSLLRQMTSAIDNWGTFSGKEKIAGQLQDLASKAERQVIKRPLRDVGGDIANDTKAVVRDFLNDVDFIADRLPAYHDLIGGFVKHVEAQVDLKIEEDFSHLTELESEFADFGKSNFLEKAANWFLDIRYLGRLWLHGSRVRELHEKIAEMRSSFDPESITAELLQKRSDVADMIKELFSKEFFAPIEGQLNDCLQKKSDKEARRTDAETKLVGLKSSYEQQERNLEKMKVALAAIG